MCALELCQNSDKLTQWLEWVSCIIFLVSLLGGQGPGAPQVLLMVSIPSENMAVCHDTKIVERSLFTLFISYIYFYMPQSCPLSGIFFLDWRAPHVVAFPFKGDIPVQVKAIILFKNSHLYPYLMVNQWNTMCPRFRGILSLQCNMAHIMDAITCAPNCFLVRMCSLNSQLGEFIGVQLHSRRGTCTLLEAD